MRSKAVAEVIPIVYQFLAEDFFWTGGPSARHQTLQPSHLPIGSNDTVRARLRTGSIQTRQRQHLLRPIRRNPSSKTGTPIATPARTATSTKLNSDTFVIIEPRRTISSAKIRAIPSAKIKDHPALP
jgi:hypothetical protein